MREAQFIPEEFRIRLFYVIRDSFVASGEPLQELWEALEYDIRKALAKLKLNDEPTPEETVSTFLRDCSDTEVLASTSLFLSSHEKKAYAHALTWSEVGTRMKRLIREAYTAVTVLFDEYGYPYGVDYPLRARHRTGEPTFCYRLPLGLDYENMQLYGLSDEDLSKRALIERDWLRQDCKEIPKVIFRIKTIGEICREEFLSWPGWRQIVQDGLRELHRCSGMPSPVLDQVNDYLDNLYYHGKDGLLWLYRLSDVNDPQTFPTISEIVRTIEAGEYWCDKARSLIETTKGHRWHHQAEKVSSTLEYRTLLHADLAHDLSSLTDVLLAQQRRRQAAAFAEREAPAQPETEDEAAAAPVPKTRQRQERGAFTLHIPGLQEGKRSGSVVLVDAEERRISKNQLKLLLKLVLYASKDTWMDRSELDDEDLQDYPDESRITNRIKRLRKALGSKEIIERDGHKHCKLNILPENITCDKKALVHSYRSTGDTDIVELAKQLPDLKPKARKRKPRKSPASES